MKTIIELREEAIKQDKNIEFYLYQLLEEQQEEIEKLNKENKELKNRIGRAIYFFEKTKAKQGDIYRVVDSYESNCISFILTDNEIKLLNILKGSDKE